MFMHNPRLQHPERFVAPNPVLVSLMLEQRSGIDGRLAIGENGESDGYSSQAYAIAGQNGWHATPDPDREPEEDDEADSNGQQDVEDRPNVGIVTPDDYPQQQ